MIINYSSGSRLIGSFQQTNNIVYATKLVVALIPPPFELNFISKLTRELLFVSKMTKEINF